MKPGHCVVWWGSAALARVDHVALLSAAERERALALAPAARARFVASCAVLRSAVGRVTDTPPAAVAIDRTCPDCGRPHGRPVLEGLACSVSYAGDRFAVAVAGAAIGIDVERIPGHVDDALLARALAPDERAALRRLPAGRRAAGFAAYWTAKEALLKACGVGLRIAPDSVRVAPPRVLAPSHLRGAALVRLDAGADCAAALAALDGPLAAVAERDAAELL